MKLSRPGLPRSLNWKASFRLLFYVFVVVLLANVGALVERVTRPEIRYFDQQHLIEGSITALVLILLLGALETYLTRRSEAEEALRESESRYQSLVDLSPDAIIVNVGGKYVFANPAAARLFGAASPQDLVGRDAINMIHPDSRELVAERSVQALAGVAPSPRDIKLLRLDGSPVEVESTGMRMEFDGRPAVQVVYRDITERKRAEELLRLTQFSVDRAADSVFWTDPGGHFIRVSEAACRLLGYSEKEFLAMSVPDLYPSASAELQSANWERMKEEGSFTFEASARTKSGSTVPLEVTVNYLQFAEREYNCAFARDITDRKQAEQERLSLERQLQHSQKLESLGVLAGGIAHDFNNILTSVLGNAELALSELSPSAPARGNLLEVMDSSHRAAALCRQMLAYSGRGHFVVEPIDLGAFIEDMLGLLGSSISKKAFLDLDLGKDLPLLEADPSQMSQVIMNLILNASEALGEKEGNITVSTGVRECSAKYLREAYGAENASPGLYLTLEVSDTGSGMDARTQERLFEPFFTTKFTGRGLGMAAVLGIVRGHKGALRLVSKPGRGTTFTILFPALEADAALPARKNGAQTGGWQGEGTVLLVDDEEAIRALGSRMLAMLGFTVLTAPDGRQALEVYREHREEIALVLLDLTMPRMDGEEAFRELRLIDPQVRVVMSSGYAESDITARFAGQGSAGFVQKPYTLAELKKGLRAALEGDGTAA